MEDHIINCQDKSLYLVVDFYLVFFSMWSSLIRPLKILEKELEKIVIKCFRYIPAAISIKHLLDHGKSANQLGSYMFLKKEIPTRLANMIMELQLLPEDLKKQKECTDILNDYISSFRWLS